MRCASTRSRLSLVALPQGSVTIQSSQLRSVAVSAESGCMRSSFFSWRSTSSMTGFGILRLLRLLLERRDLLAQLVALAQLGLDRLQLLAQEELALRAVHLALGLGRDLLLHGEHLELLRHQLVHAAQPLQRIDRLQDLLRALDLEVQVRGREVRQAPGLLHVGRDDDDLGRDGLAQVGGLLERGLDVAHQGLDLEVPLLHLALGDGSTFAWRCGWPSSKPVMRARPMPWTRTRMRPSGSFSIRMMRATVPTG